MSFFKRSATKASATSIATPITAKDPSSSEAFSESTINMDDEWYSCDNTCDPSTPTSSLNHRPCLHSNLTPKSKVTGAFEGCSAPSTPPPTAVSLGSSSFDSHECLSEESAQSSSCGSSLPPQLNFDTWNEVSASEYPVRSADYLTNRRKQSFEKAAMSLWAVDLIQTDEPISLCGHSQERLQQSLRQGTAPKFCFAVNICLPAPKNGSKVKASFYQFVAYFGVNNKRHLFDDSSPVGRLAKRFCFSDSDIFRNETFKLIPKIVHGGSFVFRQAVGSKPVLLGQKVSQKYYRTEDYCEVLVDIASDPIAKRIVRMALGLASHLTVDLSFCLEGKTVETLPEQLLGGIRVQGLNFAEDGQRYVPVDKTTTL